MEDTRFLDSNAYINSTAITADTAGPAITFAKLYDINFSVNVEAVTTLDGTNYLAAIVQTSIDGGTTWVDSIAANYRHWPQNDITTNWDGKLDAATDAGKVYNFSWIKESAEYTHMRLLLRATGSPSATVSVMYHRLQGFDKYVQPVNYDPLRTPTGFVPVY